MTTGAMRSARGRAATASGCSSSLPRAWPPYCDEEPRATAPSRRSDAGRPTTHSPIGEVVRLGPVAGRHHGLVVWRVPADGVGGRGVAGQPQRLAAAAAPVLLLATQR